MNKFSNKMGNLDVRVVLISALKRPGIIWICGVCVDAPLGSGACPANESNPPKYKHIVQQVDSNNALEKIVGTYPQWKDMLREDALLHFMVVSDDNSSPMTAPQFINQMAARNPSITDFFFHGITATKGCAAERGVVYETLVQQTGGIWGELCDQNFDPVFDAIIEAMISSSMSCEWEIPEPPEGEEFDKEMVNLEFKDNDSKMHRIGHVVSKDDCDKVENGWYYDSEDDPTKIFVCSQTCDWIKEHKDGEISIQFGCETEVIVM
ncbi:MAG: hypothetical protein GY847_18760 [Proteobacteria bacterium]|nr:hypothetical protein [Pseudomonadota bacterium]